MCDFSIDSQQQIILSKSEFNSLDIVSGCSGSKYVFHDSFLMLDSQVGKKDKSLCLKKELEINNLKVDKRMIQLLIELLEPPIELKLNEEKVKKALITNFNNLREIEIDYIFEILLNSSRRYNAATIFEIAKVNPGETVVRRYVAYFRLAELMGLKQYVADAEYCIIDLDGKKLGGCIIKKANGFDIANWNKETAEQKRLFKLKCYKGSFFRTISQIHILDYIAGYVDRNPSNMIYEVNDGYISNAIAIDNDTCFGNSSVEDLKETRLGNLQDIRYIDSNLQQQIMKISEKDIADTLQNYLNEREIEAICLRYREIKGRVKSLKGVMSDWNELNKCMMKHPYIIRINECIDNM